MLSALILVEVLVSNPWIVVIPLIAAKEIRSLATEKFAIVSRVEPSLGVSDSLTAA